MIYMEMIIPIIRCGRTGHGCYLEYNPLNHEGNIHKIIRIL